MEEYIFHVFPVDNTHYRAIRIFTLLESLQRKDLTEIVGYGKTPWEAIADLCTAVVKAEKYERKALLGMKLVADASVRDGEVRFEQGGRLLGTIMDCRSRQTEAPQESPETRPDAPEEAPHS